MNAGLNLMALAGEMGQMRCCDGSQPCLRDACVLCVGEILGW